MNERRWHLSVPGLVGALGLVVSAMYSQNTVIAMFALTVACMGVCTVVSQFWNLPPAFLGGAAAAAGIAFVNAMGNVAGFVSPYLVGWVKDLTRSTNIAVYRLAASHGVRERARLPDAGKGGEQVSADRTGARSSR